MQAGQNRCARFEVAAGQFARHEGMHEHETVGQAIGQRWLSPPEVLNPDGGIGEHHADHRLFTYQSPCRSSRSASMLSVALIHAVCTVMPEKVSTTSVDTARTSARATIR